jgi:hypothetical protein
VVVPREDEAQDRRRGDAGQDERSATSRNADHPVAPSIIAASSSDGLSSEKQVFMIQIANGRRRSGPT